MDDKETQKPLAERLTDTPRISPPGFYLQQIEAINYLYKWFKSKDKVCTLEGYAGTGKTFLMRYFIDNIVTCPMVVTAPTHKALRVLERVSNRKGMTIQSLCGLRPNTNVTDFNIEDPSFSITGEVKLSNYGLVIIDEASMVNPGIFNLMCTLAKEYKCKLLFVGDSLQLPYVVRRKGFQIDSSLISPVFTDVENHIKLTEIVRQEQGNPLLELFAILRDDILNNTNNFSEYIVTHRGDINSQNEGYIIMDNPSFKTKIKELFLSEDFSNNLEYIRLATYTNDSVNNWNTWIRSEIVPDVTQILHQDDLLTAYSTIFDEFLSPIIINSEDYIIKNFYPYEGDDKIPCYVVNLQSVVDGRITEPFRIINHRDRKGFNLFVKATNYIHSLAKQARSSKGWFKYFNFKNTNLIMVPIKLNEANSSRVVSKDIDYGYALTTHKLQGSTFDNIAIDLENIMFYKTKTGQRVRREPREYLRLIYVALSRAKRIAYIKL